MHALLEKKLLLFNKNIFILISDQQSVDDEVFAKRHMKQELEEKRRKR